MSSIASVTSPGSTPTGATAATATPASPTQSLGINDFMKLLATQFEQQDPLKPMDDTAFIAQTAQFTSLQQTQTLVQQITQLNASQSLATANSYLGLQVSVTTPNGQTDTGNVTAVDNSGAAPQILVNGQSYPLSAVTAVHRPAASTPAATPTS